MGDPRWKGGAQLPDTSAFGEGRRGDAPFQGSWGRSIIVLTLAVFYIASFPFISHSAGLVAAALVVIPVGAAGWLFGTQSGLAAAIAGIMLSGVLAGQSLGTDMFSAIRIYWPGYLMVIAFGYVAGAMRAMSSEASRVRTRLRSREQFLVLIGAVTNSVLEEAESEAAYRRLTDYLTQIFSADDALLARWDERRQQAILIDTSGARRPESGPDRGDVPDPTALVAAVMRSQHVMAIEDVAASAYAPAPGGPRALPRSTKSALCIPLITLEHGFGAVTLMFEGARRFDPEELIFADLFSRQVALALWTMEQKLEIQKRLREADALMDIEHALSASERVGIEAILQLIVNSAKELIQGAERAVVHLIDEEGQILIPRAVAGVAEATTGRLNMHVGEGIAGYVIQTGEVIGISDTLTEPRFLNGGTPTMFRSLITAPIESNERRLGTISIMSRQPGSFSAADAHLLGALGTYAAIAIGNADLLETTREDLKEINALYRVNQGLAASLDPDRLMKDVTDLLRQNFGYYHVQCYMVEPEQGDLVARHGSGAIGDVLRERGHRLPRGTGIVGHVVETGQPFVTTNVHDVPFFARNPLLPNTTSELSVPIKIEERVVGALDIQLAPPDHLGPRDLQLLSAVANQLAVALQKAELYTELEASLKHAREMRIQLMHSERLALIGRLLASVSHELNNPLQAIQNALFLLKDESALSTQARQDLDVILSEAERMASLIGRLRSTYRPTTADGFEEIHLETVIEDVHRLTSTYMRHRKITFQFSPDGELPAMIGVQDQIRQVVLNLFMNAIDAMPMEGLLAVELRRLPEEGKILLSVADTGPGIRPELLPHIFEPFVTDKETGTGLGLTITYDIVCQHQGTIEAENLPGGGARFKVWFPVKEAVAA